METNFHLHQEQELMLKGKGVDPAEYLLLSSPDLVPILLTPALCPERLAFIDNTEGCVAFCF